MSHDLPFQGFTRRELLAFLAGVPVASLVGCGLSGAGGFEGELISPDFSIGHRLRDGWRPPEPASLAARHRVVIVGAGIAGLSAAWQLRRRGITDFVVLELGDQAGGTSLSGQRDGIQFPWGAHYVPAPMRENEDLIAFFEQMGVVVGRTQDGDPVVAEQYLCREPEERVFVDGQWLGGLYPHLGSSENDLAQLDQFRSLMQSWAARRDDSGRRMFAIPMSTGSDDAVMRSLDQISMDRWMATHDFTSQRLLWLVDYACRDDYGLTIRQTSAWAGLYYFASRLRGDGSESQPVITWPAGNGQIVQYLADQFGDQLKCSHAVTSIEDQDDGGIHVRAFDTKASSTIDFVAEDVIFAAPQFIAPHVIADWPTETRSVKSFRYGGWVVANVTLSGRPAESGYEMCWDNVIVDSQSLGYVAATHQMGLDHGPMVLTWYQPMLDEDPRVSRAELMRLKWCDWASVIVSDFKKAHPDIVPLIERIDVMRWGHAMIQPRVGFVWSDDREKASESIGRIHFASTDLSGIALMEEAFDRGLRAAEQVA